MSDNITPQQENNTIPVVCVQIGQKIFFNNINEYNQEHIIDKSNDAQSNVSDFDELKFDSIFNSSFNSNYSQNSNYEINNTNNTINDNTNKIENSNNSNIENLNNKNYKNSIISLGWFYNISSNLNIKFDDKDENVITADLCTIGFNLNFGNLRIELFKKTEHSFINNVAFLDKFKKLCYGTIYQNSVMNLLYSTHSIDLKIDCIEQLINYTGEEWQLNRPIVRLYAHQESDINKNYISIRIDNINNGVLNSISRFNFVDWQIASLKHCFEFVINGGYSAIANHLNKNNY